MDNGLAYFKKVYDDVPGWVQKMHDYYPEALTHYTGLRSEIMCDGHLSTKEKDLLLVGINAARLYERSMLYHTKGAIDRGATISELAEYLLVSFAYGGKDALNMAFRSLEYAQSFDTSVDLKDGSVETILARIIEAMGAEDTSFIRRVMERVHLGKQGFVEQLFYEGVVSSKLKYILMASIYITELQGEAARKWIQTARDLGATDEELAETGLICMLTAGIPAWFETSDLLKEKQFK